MLKRIIEKIIQLIKAGKIKEITDIRDETDLGGLKIAIDIKRSADPEMIMTKLFSLTPLCDSFSCNFNLLIDGRPQTLGIERHTQGMGCSFRMDCIKRQHKIRSGQKKHKAPFVAGTFKNSSGYRQGNINNTKHRG